MLTSYDIGLKISDEHGLWKQFGGEIPAMTISQQKAVLQAIATHRNGQLDRAREMFEALLARNPEQVESLHFLGVLEFQQGHAVRAIELISKALQLSPDYVDAYVNLGNVLYAEKHFAESYACCVKAHELAPDRFDVLENLGVYSLCLGKLEESVDYLQRAAVLRPDLAAAHYNLGNSLSACKHHEQALQSFRRCVELDSEFGPAQAIIGVAAYRAGNQEVASEHYRNILQQEPDNALVQHMLAASSGENMPERCTPQSVRQLFDRHAAKFDKNLTALGYGGPAMLAEKVDAMELSLKSLRILDACCGTGLCAPVLRPLAAHLDGVDLSAGMLEKARQTNLYDSLHESDVIDFVSELPARYDLIACMDALNYFGRLDEVILAIANALAEGGTLFFTLEKAGFENVHYQLGMHGRYQHTRRYIESLAANCPDSRLLIEECVVRKELGNDVDGWLCTIEK